ncbi:microfibril-associated glycoprotein 4-like [Anopheles merus]|uniref:microfibril-associated glycoprotein 4-like n=1 Tax=Anopheles merus TaxID=30066 RepID=UPI001BE4394C|nr:microfibril-associated glycoprotein 4-like [Anopheles merus]
MYVLKVIVPLLLMLFLSHTGRGDDHHNTTDRRLPGFAYEMIANKLEYMQDKLIAMESAIKEDRKLIDQQTDAIHANHAQMKEDMQLLVRKFIDAQTHSNKALIEAANANQAKMKEEIQLLARKCIDQQTETFETNNAQIRDEIQQLASKKDLARFMTISGLNLHSISFESCKENILKRSGQYLIQPTENNKPFRGYCEQTAFGGGWLVIQYRYDGSVDFYRNWTEYRNGFGSMDGEFWLGLEYLHRMTSARKHELLVELKDFEGNYMYARYDEFAIGSEEEQYPLAKLGAYTGTTGDALSYHKGMKFTTKDRDNDLASSNCANNWKGAWWYKACHGANLNGLYRNSVDGENIVWNAYKRYWGLAYSRMMIREI